MSCESAEAENNGDAANPSELQARRALHARWRLLLDGLGVAGGRSDAAFRSVARSYSQPGRRYHNLAHISDALEVLDRLRHLARDPVAAELAIWLHDMVYDASHSDNEEQSALTGAAMLTALGVQPELAEHVCRLVRFTRDHRAEGDPDAAVVIDADLASLAASWDRFAHSSECIRQEYWQLSDTRYREGRAVFLRGVLDREWIFQTTEMRQRCEEIARRNLARALVDLSRQGWG